ncbi:MAG: transporter [Verrucomicrobia bacterium]|nr:transporter [Verrucomicrobiota bacterium]
MADAAVRSWKAGSLQYSRRGLVSLFSWLLWGDFTLFIMARAVPPVFQLLLKKFEASNTLVAFLTGSLPAIIGLTIVPIVSYQSDRHRGKRGRRIPYLLFFTPVAMLALVGLAFSPGLGAGLHALLGRHSPGLNPSILLCLGVGYGVYQMAMAVVAAALFHALINDVVPRELLGRFYGLFRAFGLLAAMIFFYWGFGQADVYFRAILIGAGLLYGSGFTIMCFKVKEGAVHAPGALAPAAGGFLRAARVYLRDGFRRPYYLLIFLAINLTWLAFFPANLFNLYFAQSVGLSLGAFGRISALTSLISFGLSYGLGSLADRFHPLRMHLVILFLYALAVGWGSLFARTATTFAIAFIAHEVLSGMWMTATASVTQRLFPQAKFAQYVSAMGIFAAGLTMVISPPIGGMLDRGYSYRSTYGVSCGFAVLALATSAWLYRKFRQYGGPDHYAAPE